MGGRFTRALLATSALATSAFGGGIALAADGAAPAAQQVDEVIVTARKQSETLQSVPMSITAMDDKELKRRGAFDVGDVIASVPNVSFSYGSGDGRNNSRQIALRGIYGTGNIGGAGTTGFYIDETPVEQSAPIKLVDVDHIEVLRGPQGTLYGARSMGGTVKIATRHPVMGVTSSEFEVNAAGVSHGGPDYGVQGTINIPIGDDLAFRGTAYYDHRGGIFNRVWGGTYPFPAGAPDFTQVRGQPVTGEDKHTDRADSYGAQLALAWKPTEALTITPKFIYQKNTADGASLADTRPDNFVQRRAFDIPEPARDRVALGSVDINYAAGWGNIFSSTSYYQRINAETEDSSEELATNNAFGFISNVGGVNTAVPFPAPISRQAKYNVTTEELRVAPNRIGAFSFIGGLFYQKTGSHIYYEQNLPGISAYAQTVYGTPTPPFPTDNLFYSQTQNEVREMAAFGELTIHASDALSATFGARAYDITTDFNRLTSGLIGGSGPAQTGKLKENGVIPKVEIDYRIDPDKLIYASAAKGFRIGGNNVAPPTGFCDASLAAIGQTPTSILTYASDSLWSYETGAKLRFPRQGVTLNGAVYYIDWSDTLQNVHLACGFNYLANAGDARSIGGEIEATVRLAQGLTWRLGGGYTDAKLTKVAPGVDAQEGDRIQQVPLFTGSTSLDYVRRLVGDMDGVFRLDATYVGKSYTTFDRNDPLHTRDAYTQVDLRAGLQTPRWEAALFVKNAFDEHGNLGDDKALALELDGRPRLSVIRPRTIGIDLRYRY